MKYICVNDYLHLCNHVQKSNEQKEFSTSELNLIKEDALKELKPRAIMALVAMETGYATKE